MKIKLPDIVESAKKRPLGIHPGTGAFVYYDELQNGKASILPLDKLNDKQKQALSVERYLTNEPGTITTLNGETVTREQAAEEIKKQSKIGKQLYEMDIQYLDFYLSQFPEKCFEK